MGSDQRKCQKSNKLCARHAPIRGLIRLFLASKRRFKVELFWTCAASPFWVENGRFKAKKTPNIIIDYKKIKGLPRSDPTSI